MSTNQSSARDAEVAPQYTVDLIKKHDKPGPRYTSYPTANEFTEDFGSSDYAGRLAEAGTTSDQPLSLYIHLPFCNKRCSFCACNVVITKREDVVEKYLEYLPREIELVAGQLNGRNRVIQYHWGGGTPTHLNVDQMRSVQTAVNSHFEIDKDAEVAIEVHPPVTTHEQIDALRELGFNRLSMGVQDLDPTVQDLINRYQTVEQTRDMCYYGRQAGFTSVNMDLIYGLPQQTHESWRQTIETVIEMRPERIACYSYAFVPWIKPHQKAITREMLPPPELKIELFLAAREMFLAAGYDAIGMDHFAVPEDELAQAASQSVLHRNFMGYTTKPAPDMLGLGISAIGDIGGAYAQNTKKLSRYYNALDVGELPIERGYNLSQDDAIRRTLISSLMCNMQVVFKRIESEFNIDFADYFDEEMELLGQSDSPVAHGFAELRDDGIFVTPLGRLFIRNIAMIFDPYLRRKKTDGPVFSRTV
jgi:oxygen-independent coproporphyrinogen III oxidase